MRRLKRSAVRAAASHGLTGTVKISPARRIPSWNQISREDSVGSTEEDAFADALASIHQGSGHVGSSSNRNMHTQRSLHDGSDSESESIELNSWTRSGGPLMRTASADTFIKYVQNLQFESEPNRNWSMEDETEHLATQSNPSLVQMGGRDPCSNNSRVQTSDRNSENTDTDTHELGNRITTTPSSITVSECHLFQRETIHNGIVFNIVKKEALNLRNMNGDFGQHQGSSPDMVAETVHIESCIAGTASECEGDEAESSFIDETMPHCDETGSMDGNKMIEK